MKNYTIKATLSDKKDRKQMIFAIIEHAPHGAYIADRLAKLSDKELRELSESMTIH